MLTLRLQRAGKKNKPEFRIILAQKTAAANKKFIEILGNYNPRTKQFAIKDEARLKYWVEQHVEISPTLNNLLVSKSLLTEPKQKAFFVPTKVKAKKAEAEAKAKEEAEAKAQAEADAAAAEKAAAEQASSQEETPVEEVATPEVAETVAEENTEEPKAEEQA